MHNYMKADLRRIAKRIPRIVLLLLILALIVFLSYNNEVETPYDIMEGLKMFLKYSPLVLGAIEILYVFGDDFRGKTAQIAIGIGISRRKVILSKWLEMVILYAIDAILVLAAAFATKAVCGSFFSFALAGELVILYLISILELACFIGLVLAFFFTSQGITMGLLIFVLLESGGISSLLGYVFNLKWLLPLHLGNFTLTNCINVFRTRCLIGAFNPTAVCGIIIYILLGYLITYNIYKKLELEF